MTANRHNGIFYGVDLWTVLLYVLIVDGGMDLDHFGLVRRGYGRLSSPSRTST